MVEKISKRQSYYNSVMAKLPDVKNKTVHSVRKGETLWNIARKNLNKKKVTNNEINNRMLLIAKINNMDSVEDMNNLKINQKIYLPSQNNTAQTVHNNKSSKAKVVVNNKIKPVIKKNTNKQTPAKTRVITRRTDAEQSVNSALNTIKNDKTVKVEKVNLYLSDCYHVSNETKSKLGSFINKNNMVMSFSVGKDKKINSIYLEDSKRNINVYGYDYKIDPNGAIRENQYPYSVKGKLSKQENNQLRLELQKTMKKAK